LNLKSDQLVLDVGCGIGGGDIYMAKVEIYKPIKMLIFVLKRLMDVQ
jgi:hypothetical protein